MKFYTAALGLAFAFCVAVFLYLNNWAETYSLATSVDGVSLIAAYSGWETLGLVFGFGLLVGLAITIVGYRVIADHTDQAANRFFDKRDAKEKAALSELRLKLSQQQADIDAEIQKNVASQVLGYQKIIDDLQATQRHLQKQLAGLHRKNQTLVGQLAGARQKHLRLKKQHN